MKKGHMISTELDFPEDTSCFDVQMEFYVVIFTFLTGFVILGKYLTSLCFLCHACTLEVIEASPPGMTQVIGKALRLDHWTIGSALQTPAVRTRRESSRGSTFSVV